MIDHRQRVIRASCDHEDAVRREMLDGIDVYFLDTGAVRLVFDEVFVRVVPLSRLLPQPAVIDDGSSAEAPGHALGMRALAEVLARASAVLQRRARQQERVIRKYRKDNAAAIARDNDILKGAILKDRGTL